jgi:hypothetical protein
MVKARSLRNLCDGSSTVSVTRMRPDAYLPSSPSGPEKPLRLHRHRDSMFTGTTESHVFVATEMLTWK